MGLLGSSPSSGRDSRPLGDRQPHQRPIALRDGIGRTMRDQGRDSLHVSAAQLATHLRRRKLPYLFTSRAARDSRRHVSLSAFVRNLQSGPDRARSFLMYYGKVAASASWIIHSTLNVGTYYPPSNPNIHNPGGAAGLREMWEKRYS